LLGYPSLPSRPPRLARTRVFCARPPFSFAWKLYAAPLLAIIRQANELRRIEPPVFPDIETIGLKGGHTVIALRVPGGGGPYSYDGRPYQRHGPTTRVMPRGVYEQRVMEKLHATNRWENQPVPNSVTIADLDEDEIQLTVDNAVDLGRLEPLKRRTTKAILTGLGLIVEGKLLNAAVALYGKAQRLQSLYPQCAIRLARFRGKDRLGDFIDNRQYWGHAFALLRRAETFLLDHVPIAGRVVSGRMKREDRPLYPPRATREAVANALCHRDYTRFSSTLNLCITEQPCVPEQDQQRRPWRPEHPRPSTKDNSSGLHPSQDQQPSCRAPRQLGCECP